MKKRTKIIIAGAAVVVALAGGTTMAVAGGGDDAETSIPASALDRAAKVALSHTGGGRVTETEVGDEESYYEVEVTLDNGTKVDVQLDESFKVVGSETDDPAKDDEGKNED